MEKIFADKCKELGIELPFVMKLTNPDCRSTNYEVASPITGKGKNLNYAYKCISGMLTEALNYSAAGKIENAELTINGKVMAKGRKIISFLMSMDCFSFDWIAKHNY